jgi:hypothetical protein
MEGRIAGEVHVVIPQDHVKTDQSELFGNGVRIGIPADG